MTRDVPGQPAPEPCGSTLVAPTVDPTATRACPAGGLSGYRLSTATAS